MPKEAKQKNNRKSVRKVFE
ncbi:hypothetical protein Gotri_003656 [Gossypium trilobum]|uniref:Uncharacterized protein n=1 Tax=Gossypium trilobum TaxID=34281 RepID=A0A7J9F265_9ROSI|nr:hypothetical protein [Gossypium trilobum]